MGILDTIQRYENASGGNVRNYEFSPQHTASGYFQMNAGTFNEYALPGTPGLPASFSNPAMNFSYDDQATAALNTFFGQGGGTFSPWVAVPQSANFPNMDPFPGGVFNAGTAADNAAATPVPLSTTAAGDFTPGFTSTTPDAGNITSGFGSSAFGVGGTPYGPVGSVDNNQSGLGSFAGTDPAQYIGAGGSSDLSGGGFAPTPEGTVSSGAGTVTDPNVTAPGQDLGGSPVSSRAVTSAGSTIGQDVGKAIADTGNAEIKSQQAESKGWLQEVEAIGYRIMILVLGLVFVAAGVYMFHQTGAVRSIGRAVPKFA